MINIASTLVLGLGRSGMAAAELLLSEGADITVVDAADSPALRAVAARLTAAGASVRLGCAALPPEAFTACIISPGIPSEAAWAREVRARQIPLRAELELGWTRRRSKVLAVTGSNGKSTVVKWLVEALQRGGATAAAAGNYGPPLSQQVRQNPPPEWLVIEVSSFQLEAVCDFRPEVGLLLNCFPNHLDRHGTMERYQALKARLFARMVRSDVAIVPEPMRVAAQGLSLGNPEWITFGTEPPAAYRFKGGGIETPSGATLSLQGTLFERGAFALNAAAVMAATEACGFAPEVAQSAATAFVGLPHRLQRVGEREGVQFINDSKATNLAALMAAATAMTVPVHLIAGGRAKEADLTLAKEVLAQKVRAVYLIGDAAEDMKLAWSHAVECVVCGSMARAVTATCKRAHRGEVILLSPGCASFDQYRSFEERGQEFIELVNQHVQEEQTCAG